MAWMSSHESVFVVSYLCNDIFHFCYWKRPLQTDITNLTTIGYHAQIQFTVLSRTCSWVPGSFCKSRYLCLKIICQLFPCVPFNFQNGAPGKYEQCEQRSLSLKIILMTKLYIYIYIFGVHHSIHLITPMQKFFRLHDANGILQYNVLRKDTEWWSKLFVSTAQHSRAGLLNK